MAKRCGRRPASHSGGEVLALASFVLMGLPDGMLGTAWPAIRAEFGAPVGDLGLLLLAATAGSAVITVFVGRLLRRLGVPVLLAAAVACAAAGAAGYALAPGLGVLLAVAALFGVAAGTMDGGLNTAIALSGRRRLLNLLHGAYGVGTAIGPLLVTAAILAGSWRPAYAVLLALDLVVAGCWLRRRRPPAWPPGAAPDAPAATDAPELAVASSDPATPAAASSGAGSPAAGPGALPPDTVPLSRRRYRGALLAGLAVFFVYTGLEVAAGQWETSYGRGYLHLSASAAGVATFGYWAALTVVRIGLALVPRLAVPWRVVRIGGGVAVAAAALIWWQPGIPATLAGFVLLGAALAGIFPALVTLTPFRLGAGAAQNAIAWQVGAAAAGGAGVSAVIGLLVSVTSLTVLGPALAVLAVALVASELLLARLAPA